MKGVLPWLYRWARRAGTRDFCPALAALVSTVLHLSPSVVLQRLSLNMCLWLQLLRNFYWLIANMLWREL
jgi:hypothetical protein